MKACLQSRNGPSTESMTMTDDEKLTKSQYENANCCTCWTSLTVDQQTACFCLNYLQCKEIYLPQFLKNMTGEDMC